MSIVVGWSDCWFLVYEILVSVKEEVEQLVVDELVKCRHLTSDVNKYSNIGEESIQFDEPHRIP